MHEDADDQIVQTFARDIAGRLNEAAILARTADGFGKDGLIERAFQSLLEVEPLIHEASVLLNAAAVVRRRDRPV